MMQQQQQQQQQQLQRNGQHQILHNAPQTRQVAIASPSLNVKAIRGLAIIQIVFGSIVFVLGIASIGASSRFWANQTGSGIWYGGWILITGIIGVFSARKPFNKYLIGNNMGFNIVCAVVSLLLVILYSIAMAYFYGCTEYRQMSRPYYERLSYSYGQKWCTNRVANKLIYSILLMLMVAEFAVSLTISILCCKCACCVRCCCQSSTGNPRPNQMIVSNQPAIIGQPGIVMRPPQQTHEIGQRKIANQSAIHQQPILTALQQPNSGVITNITPQGATTNDESQMNGGSNSYF